jgi:outer membrane protein insertion porin family
VCLGLALPAGPLLAQTPPIPPPTTAPASPPPVVSPAQHIAPDLPAPPEESSEPAGPTVTAIEIRSEVPLDDPDEISNLLSFGIGDPLSEEEIVRSLRNLQTSGAASSVELYTRPEGNGVVAIVVLRSIVRVRSVKLEGSLGLSESDLRRVLPQKEAEPLNEEQVLQGIYQLQDLYRDHGYFEPDVRVHVDTDATTQRAAVIYQVQSGPRSTVSEIRFQGDITPYQPADLIKQLDIGPGDPFAERAVRDDSEHLQNWLIRQSYRTARVDPPEEQVDHERHTVQLVYPIEVGPQVVLEVTGADAKKLQGKGLLPFLDRQGYDQALLIQSTERIKTWYQQEGHYKVKSESKDLRAEGVLKVSLNVDPGPVYTLQEIRFTGNETFTKSQLMAYVQTSERSLLRPGSGRLVDAVLKDDLDNLRSFYAVQGFSQAQIGPQQIEERGDDLFLTIPIQEGPRQQVVDLTFEGVEKLDLKDVRPNLSLKEGGPFHPFLLDRTLEALRLAYRDKGYADVQISSHENWNAEHTLVDITIEVLEGPQTVLDRVIVRGNRRTVSDVIRRTIDVQSGEPISETRRLEIERDLYQLGIFSSVQVALTSAGLESATRDLIVRVEEGRPRRVSYGLGFEYDSTQETKWVPRGSISFTHNNVAGRAYSLRSDLRISQLDKVFRVLFDQPYIGRAAVPLTYSLFYFDERKDHWDVVRWGGRIEAVRNRTDRRFSLAYDYRMVDTELDPEFHLFDVDRQDRPYQLSSLIPSVLLDHRNDPVSATRGWSSLAQVQYAFPLFAADGNFLKLFLQQTQYLDLRNLGVVAASLRLGGIEPFAKLPGIDPELPKGAPNADVFIDERFFAGGATTHRAYGRDDLGRPGETLIPRPQHPDELAPVGGNGLLLFNLEYRFPLFGALGGTVFFDDGNVWADWRDIDLSQLKPGAGVGLRYLSPIGPLRVDIGWKLDRREDEPAYAVFVSFGNPF